MKRINLRILVCLVVLQSCIDTATPVDKAVVEIDKVLKSSAWQSDLWRGEVDRLVTKLETIDEDIGRQASYIVGKSIASGGAEIRCDVDFMRDRMKQDLQNLRDHLLGKPIQLPPPKFCGVEPSGIEMEHRPAFLEFYGYDLIVREYIGNSSEFNEIRQVHAFLVYDGGEIDLEPWTDFPTHYKMTIKTSQSDNIPLCNKDGRHIVFRITSTGAPLGNSVGIARASCPVAPTPLPPKPEQLYYQTTETIGAVVPGFGWTDNREYGGACSTDYHRSRQTLNFTEKVGGAGCYFVEWKGDENSCKIEVRLWVDAFSGGKCEVKIFEIGNPQPPPAAPPCDCW